MLAQNEKNLIRLARSIYELILYAQNKEECAAYEALASQAKSIFDDFDNAKGTLHSDLGFNILEFAQLKTDGNNATSEYEDYAREMIERLEKKYGL
jgi:hypothetical protein